MPNRIHTLLLLIMALLVGCVKNQYPISKMETELINLEDSEIDKIRYEIPASRIGAPNFWKDKYGNDFNLYYNLNRTGRFKRENVDYSKYYELCKAKYSPQLSFLLNKKTTSFFITGDSIIHGGGASDQSFSYISMIKSRLGDRNYFMSTYPGRSLRSYITDLSSSIYSEDIKGKIILFAWGMNDQVYKDAHQFGVDYRSFLSIAKRRGAAHVVVFSTIYPDEKWAFSNAEIIKEQNSIMQLSDDDFVTFLNVTDLLKSDEAAFVTLSEVNHPSNYGHAAHYYCFSSLL